MEFVANLDQVKGDIFYFDWEVDVLQWFQSIHTGSSLQDNIVLCITHLGKAGLFWMFITLCMLIFCGWKNRKSWTNLAAFIFDHEKQIAWASFWALVFSVMVTNVILKNVTSRARPAWIMIPQWPMLVEQDDFSFPSGHTSASFASATAIFCNNKKWGVPALILAFLIALSRLYLFIHWPTDVIVGMIVGICGGIFGSWLSKKIASKNAIKAA